MKASFISTGQSIFFWFMASVAMAGMATAQDARFEAKPLSDLSYMYGWEAAIAVADDGLLPGIKFYQDGFIAGMTGQVAALSEAEMQAARDRHQARLRDRLLDFSAHLKSQGDAFRAEFAKKEGVRETVEGLLYRFKDTGTGETPLEEQTIKVSFHSYIPGFGVVDLAPNMAQPLNLKIDAAPLAGMRLAARMLRAGGIIECVIPPHLAYGEDGGGEFPPNSTFVIEMRREGPQGGLADLVLANPYENLPKRLARVITMADDISYVMGFEDAKRAYIPGTSLVLSSYLAGYTDAASGKEPAVDDRSAEDAVAARRAWVDARNQKIAKETEPMATSFMNKVSTRPDVHATASGLLYRVIQKGNGALPVPGTFLKVSCEAKLFDREETIRLWPVDQPMNVLLSDGLLPGLLEGLLMMPMGSEYEFFVPSHLALGDSGSSSVPPGAALTLRVKVLSQVED